MDLPTWRGHSLRFARNYRAGYCTRADESPTLKVSLSAGNAALATLVALPQLTSFTGGYTYFHRPAPLLYSQLCGAEPAVNYLLVPFQLVDTLLPSGYVLVEDRGWLGLFHRAGSCESMPDASPRS